MGLLVEEAPVVVESHEDALTFVILVGSTILAYYILLLLIYRYCKKQLPVTIEENSLPRKGSLRIENGVSGHLCGNGCTYITLFPDLNETKTRKVSGPISYVALVWFRQLDPVKKFTTLWHFVDIASDFSFVWTFQDEYLPLVCVALASLLVTTVSLFMMFYFSILLFQTHGSQDLQRAKEQRVLKLRWGILVFVPWEDIIMIGLAVYQWGQEKKSRTDTLVAFMSICVSAISIAFLQIGTLLCEVNGLFEWDVQEETCDAGETNGANLPGGEVGEPDHAMIGVELSTRRVPDTASSLRTLAE